MKQLVVCTEDFPDYYESCLDFGQIDMNDQRIYYALIERDPIAFDAQAQPYKVLIQKQAFSCNYRDRGIMGIAHAEVTKRFQDGNLAYYPIGSEFSGIVIQVGKNVTKLKVGDRVIPDGSYPGVLATGVQAGLPTNHASSELEVIHEQKLIKIPETVSFEAGAAFTIGAQTVYSMLEKLNIQEGEKVLITGLPSNTALFALQALKDKNVELYGLARKNIFEKQLLDLGLKQLFLTEDLKENKAIHEHIKKNGEFNCVIDPFSDSHLFELLDFMSLSSRYATCGISQQLYADKSSLDLNKELFKIILKNITIYGNCLGNTQHLATAIQDFAKGRLQVVIDTIIHNDIKSFMDRTFISKERFGKVVFSYN